MMHKNLTKFAYRLELKIAFLFAEKFSNCGDVAEWLKAAVC